MRLLAGLVAGFGWETELVGDDSLSLRPMDRVAEPLELMGATVDGLGVSAACPRCASGAASCTGIDWTSQVASAQVKSAILLAGLSAHRGPPRCARRSPPGPTPRRCWSRPVPTSPSSPGARAGWSRSGRRPCARSTARVPGDPSAAAFFVVAGCVVPESVVDVRGVYQGPARLGFATVLRRMGGQVVFTLDDDSARPAHDVHHGPGRAAARHRRRRRPRSPRWTRYPPWPWPPRWPRASRCSMTWGSSGSRRSTGWPP